MTALSKRALHRLSNVEHRARGGKRRCLRQKISVSSTPRRYGRALKADRFARRIRPATFPNFEISQLLNSKLTIRILNFNSRLSSVYFKVKSEVVCKLSLQHMAMA